jgi:hypothetical protein
MARLDVPTFDDPVVQRRLEDVTIPQSLGNSSVAWGAIRVLFKLGTNVLRLISELSVLAAVVQDQRDGPLFAVIDFARTLFFQYRLRNSEVLSPATGLLCFPWIQLVRTWFYLA